MSERRVATCLWFGNGRAREAAEFYASIFPDSAVGTRMQASTDYPAGNEGDELAVEFTILGMPFMGLNGGPSHQLSEAVSVQVFTDSQAETDRYWHAIVANGGAESQCGWCRDRFGLSWQIIPRALMRAMTDPDRQAAKRAMEAMMRMTRIDIAAIEQARAGTPMA